ncbi:MAG: nickel-type superoxide dismutase maturation protease [Anaerolineales bacterium]|nr:nickel-type superoxide dismutase maturation protease [Anaerolineales bacterium]
MYEIPEIRWQEFVLWLFRRRKRYQVQGNSMLPLLKPGEEVLADPHAYTHRNPFPGEIVVASHPHRSALKIIKRVRAVSADGRVDLAGDNPAESTDFDALGPEHLLGRVTSRFG